MATVYFDSPLDASFIVPHAPKGKTIALGEPSIPGHPTNYPLEVSKFYAVAFRNTFRTSPLKNAEVIVKSLRE